MSGNQYRTTDETLILRKLLHFLRSCREEGVSAERAREALLGLGFDRALIAEADRRIDDGDSEAGLEALGETESDENRPLLIPDEPLARLRDELRAQVSRARQSAEVSTVRVSVLPGGRVTPPPPPIFAERISGERSGRDVERPRERDVEREREEDTLPGLTAQMLAEAPLLAAADASEPTSEELERTSPELLMAPRPLVRAAVLRKLLSAAPAILTVIVVAWAALHVPPRAHGPAFHIHEALMAPPASVTLTPGVRVPQGAQIPQGKIAVAPLPGSGMGTAGGGEAAVAPNGDALNAPGPAPTAKAQPFARERGPAGRPARP